MSVILQLRNDTSTNWSTVNPVLAEGEVGLELDTKKIKVGDGVKTWSQLSYWVDESTSVKYNGSTAVGSLTQGIYVAADGTATSMTYSLNATVPANAVFTDTLNTAGATDTSSKIFLVGAESQSTNPQTYTQDTAFVDANGRLNSAAPASDANDTTVATTKWVKDQSYALSTDIGTGTLTIQVNGVDLQTFNANSSSDVTANILVPDSATWGNITGTLANQTDLQGALDNKVDKTTTADKVYGTDAQGNQTTYDKNSFGQVDDVTVGGTSVVANKVAVLGSMAGETASDYVLVSNVVNDVVSTDTNKPLSANMGKELQDQVDNLKARGRFLALWDCSTGLAETHPTVSPYEYKAGDYFIVGVVAQAGGTNYKPSGSSYTDNVPSTAVETEDVSVDDVYYYDGNVWHLQINTQKEIAFVNIAGDPYDNSNLASALNNKQDELPSQTGQSGKFLTTNGTAVSWGSAPVTDVQVKGTSVVTNGVANVGVAGDSSYGVVKTNSTTYGIGANADGILFLRSATTAQIDAKTTSFFPIMPSTLDYAVKVGVTTNTNTLTTTEKTVARTWIGAGQTTAVFVDWSD